jgi:hypothetical protein
MNLVCAVSEQARERKKAIVENTGARKCRPYNRYDGRMLTTIAVMSSEISFSESSIQRS